MGPAREQCRLWMCSAAAVAMLVSSLAAARLPAQESDSADQGRNYRGLMAGGALASTWVGFGDEATSGKWAGRLDFGYRFPHLCIKWFPVLCWQRVPALRPLRLTGGVTLVATDIRGMDPEHDQYAYANVDVGLRASYTRPIGTGPRLYLELRQGKRTAELISPSTGQTWNYSGPGTAFGGGIEIPFTPSGRGLDIGFTYGRARFTMYEYLETETPADLRNRATIVHVGWSGPFSGISLPWQ